MIIINLFNQVFNVSVSSTQRQIFLTALVFDIMQVLIAVIEAARHYQLELWTLLPIEHLPSQSQQ